MNVRTITTKTILTPQKRGFLTEGTYPFTHTLSWAVGCGFGNIYCGKYCYAQMIPNWLYNRAEGEEWGDAVILKENAPDVLAAQLARSRKRQQMRIFMSSVTDPYQPLEARYRLSRRCLQVFAQYPDLDLLVIQTRSPLVADDFDLIASIPYAWLSITLETDRADLPYGPNAAMIRKRLATIKQAAALGIPTQITISPCLPHTPGFADLLLQSGVQRIVVDTFVDGDGARGARTESSPFATDAEYDWRDTDPAHQLYATLQGYDISTGWSAAGFGGIAPREARLL